MQTTHGIPPLTVQKYGKARPCCFNQCKKTQQNLTTLFQPMQKITAKLALAVSTNAKNHSKTCPCCFNQCKKTQQNLTTLFQPMQKIIAKLALAVATYSKKYSKTCFAVATNAKKYSKTCLAVATNAKKYSKTYPYRRNPQKPHPKESSFAELFFQAPDIGAL